MKFTTIDTIIFYLELYGALYYFWGFHGMAWGAVVLVILTILCIASESDKQSNV